MHCELCTLPDVIGSTTRALHRLVRTRRSVRFLSIIIAALFVLTAGMVVLTADRAEGVSQAPIDETARPHASPSRLEGGWDWAGLASDSGLVDAVLLFDGAPGQSEDRASLVADLTNGKAGLALRHEFSNALSGMSVSMPVEDLDALLDSNPTLTAYPDLTVEAFLGESILSIGADDLWVRTDPDGYAVTGYGMVVAVIDTGIDYTHPDLGGGFGPAYKVIGGYDFYNHDSDPMDDNGHGTHVAGVVAADGTMTGVAPDAKLLAYKSLGSDGTGSMSDVIAAIDAALDPNGDGNTEDRADVISMSLGGQGEVGDPICMAVQNAVEMGVVVVVAAGNSGPSMNTVASPGVSPYAITVGAVDDSGNLAAFSSRGPTPDLTIKPDLSAPGVNIVSTVPIYGAEMSNPTGYMSMSGTSMATPHVSGAAALLLQLHPDWSPSQVKSALVLGADEIDESVWAAGAGEVWIPGGADASLFYSQPIVSYGIVDGISQSITISNEGSGVTITSHSSDWFALYADGETAPHQWTNASSVSPSPLSISSGSSADIELNVVIEETLPEGYYEGRIAIDSAAGSESLPFGFVILSKLSVHVLDAEGREVFDPYGGVWVFNLPDADIAMGIRGNIEPAPPATFFLPSGDYSVHSFGHQLLYTFSDPYILSTTITLDRVEVTDVYLRMEDARLFTIDLGTYDGVPIYVKDYRVYCRHEGGTNISFDLVGSDYSVVGSDVFSIPDSVDVYISDTNERIGISVAGFSYSPEMWDFMELNWEHWYEYTSGTSTEFMVEAGADLQYLMSWEFDGIDPSTPTLLDLDPDLMSTYVTKYDIPGAVVNPWCDWGTHRSIGGDATFFVRRDTDTSLNPFFSGMTRTTFVQGVFSELYYPFSIFEGFIERQFYEPDYDHVVDALTLSKIQVPDRYYVTPLSSAYEVQRIGAGPFYPSLYTSNTDDKFVLYQPLLRDQSGAKVGGMTGPSMTLYRGGALVGIYSLSEYLARPDAVRTINLTQPGEYSAVITYEPSSQVTDSVTMELGFVVPGIDVDPPRLMGMQMPQRFIPGQSFEVSLEIEDDQAVDIVIEWRPAGTTSWTSLTAIETSPGTFDATLTTGATDTAIDLRIEASDASGNYLIATMTNAALEEREVLFELYPVNDEISFRTAPDTVLLTGFLTDGAGNPISSKAGIPLELMVEGRKVGMILDEYIASGAHSHTGEIRFEWRVSPSTLFSGPNQTVEVSVEFDLGVYGVRECSFVLNSIPSTNPAPKIFLMSPADGSLILEGTVIDLDIVDDGDVTAEAFLDGESIGVLETPWDIDTSGWDDGLRELTVIATDDQFEEATATYEFVVDGTPPDVMITYPPDGTVIPRGGTLTADVDDANIAAVVWCMDGGEDHLLEYPYALDMSNWTYGPHTVEITATDLVGLSTSDSVSFEISERSVVINLLSPEDGSVVKSGVPIELLVLGDGAITCSWSTDGVVWHPLDYPYTISTDGWDEGAYSVTVNATDGYDGWDEMTVGLEIDDTAPDIVLISPEAGSFVGPDDCIQLEVVDDHFEQVAWDIWGATWTCPSPCVNITLMNCPQDGYFTVTVTATDVAGNEGSGQYTFAMDSAPPIVTFDNVVDNGAIAATGTIETTILDAFLGVVTVAWDDGAAEVVPAPYDIDVSDVSLGWHDILITATDMAGQTTEYVQRIYVDGTSPGITTDIADEVGHDQPATIRAQVIDDFAVYSVTVHYENPDGSYSAKRMDLDGATYVTVLDPELLTDGMTVYVRASDTSGNEAESEHITLRVSTSPVDESDDTVGDSGISPSTIAGISGAAIAAGLLLLVLYSKKGRKGKKDGDYGVRKNPEVGVHSPAKPATKIQRPPTTPPGKSVQPDQSFIPKIMISETGVVYCTPVKIPANRIVKRPPIQRAHPPQTSANGDKPAGHTHGSGNDWRT